MDYYIELRRNAMSMEWTINVKCLECGSLVTGISTHAMSNTVSKLEQELMNNFRRIHERNGMYEVNEFKKETHYEEAQFQEFTMCNHYARDFCYIE